MFRRPARLLSRVFFWRDVGKAEWILEVEEDPREQKKSNYYRKPTETHKTLMTLGGCLNAAAALEYGKVHSW